MTAHLWLWLFGAGSVVLIVTPLRRRGIPLSASRTTTAAGSSKRGGYCLSVQLAVLVLGLAAAVLASSINVMIVVVVGWGFGRKVETIRNERSRAAAEEQAVVRFIDELTRRQRAGGALGPGFLATVNNSPTISDRLQPMIASVRAGEPLARALDRAVVAGPLRLVVSAVAVLLQRGGPSAVALERLAEVLRDRQAAAMEAKTQAGQAVASGSVMAALPLVFSAGLALVEAGARDLLLHTVVGGVCSVVMVTLIGVGWLWMEHLVDDQQTGVAQ